MALINMFVGFGPGSHALQRHSRDAKGVAQQATEEVDECPP